MLSAKTNNPIKHRPSGSRWLILVSSLLVMLGGLLGAARPALAQLAAPIAVDNLITVNQPPTQTIYPAAPFAAPCDNTAGSGFPGCDVPLSTINTTFGATGGADRVLQAIEVGGSRFEPATNLSVPPVVPDRVEFRRAGVSLGVGGVDRQLIFNEQIGGPPNIPLSLSASEVGEAVTPGIETIADVMLSPVVNRGIDNVFNNAFLNLSDQDTRNNIERIDYIIGNGAQIDSSVVGLDDVGFLILERGGNDAFGIAAITALDGAGNPTAYGPLVQVPDSAWGGGGNIGANFRSAVLRKDEAAPVAPAFRPTHTVENQSVRGIFFPISSLLLAPPNPTTVFGFSLFAADVLPGADLVNFAGFPNSTNGTTEGGLDLIAGGFGLIRQTGGFSLVKRISNLIGPANLPDFTQVLGSDSAITLLRNNNLGQGQITVADPPVTAGNGIEYTVYLANNTNSGVTDLLVCDQIPAGTTFNPDAYGAGLGIQAIASSSPAGPVLTYTGAADGDPGTFFAPGAALPGVCGANQNNGAVVVDVGAIDANEVGLVRFQTTVN